MIGSRMSLAGVSLKRWAIVRRLVEQHCVGIADVSQILCVDVEVIQAAANKQDWKVPLHGQISSGSEQTVDRGAFVKTAYKTIELLQLELVELENTQPEASKGNASLAEVRTKSLLSISRAIQNLEEIIEKTESAIDVTQAYPSDTMEYCKKLERQIERLANI